MAPASTETNDAIGSTPEKFVLKDTPIENHRPLRVVVVGAGFSGILAAIRSDYYLEISLHNVVC